MMKFVLILMMLTRAAPAENVMDEQQSLIEEHIPFDLSITPRPFPGCSPMELTAEVAGDRVSWCVMDGDRIQCRFDTFDDLYYQCDGPACFMIAMPDGRRWHVCLK